MTPEEQQQIADLTARVTKLENLLGSVARAFGGSSDDAAIATDRMMDHEKGDPLVKLTPRDWKGVSMKNKHFSECPPDFLDVLAESFDFFAKKNDERGEKTPQGKPKGDFDRWGAKLARGWAKRLRDGWQPKAKPEPKTAANPFANRNGAPPPAQPPPPTAPLGGPVQNPFAKGAAAPPLGAKQKLPEPPDVGISFNFGANAKTSDSGVPPSDNGSGTLDDAFEDRDESDAFPDAASEDYEDMGDAPF
jgi:hypothetical protein